MSNAASIPGKNLKRERDAPDGSFLNDNSNDASTSPVTSLPLGASTSNFRNVSACNRCRNRKNRCDQKLPRCSNCERVNAKCVGFDPVSKREIPRSYVYYLETRVRNLEALLTANHIPCPPASDDFPIDDTIQPGVNVPFPVQDEDASSIRPASKSSASKEIQAVLDPALKQPLDHERLVKAANNIGMVPVQTAPDPRSLSSTTASATASGISFARVVFAAVKRSVNHSHASTPSEKDGLHNPSSSTSRKHAPPLDGNPTMRDSFFGLHTRPSIPPAPFPDKALGARLAELYFEHANPQIPALHRGEFTALFERVYATEPRKRGPRELYLLNIVFAIGSGIIMDSSDVEHSVVAEATEEPPGAGTPSRKRQRLASQQHQPEEYHASAIVHLESFLGSTPATDGVGGGLEELQAVLLLAGLALLRPVAPGLWYIIGVAVRLSIDLGLHFEDIDHDLDNRATQPDSTTGAEGLGRKQWTRDLRRRLWWCVFNLDRLVSSCVGRPVSINESVVTTEFPSLLDDKYITPAGFLKPPAFTEGPSYKLVSRHYLRLRLLQSEILQVLQHRQGDQARQLGANKSNQYIIPDLASPFLQRFHSFQEWRADIDRRLWQWKEEAPRQVETGVAFTPLFYELNFWQAIIMLYRQSLAVPEPLASELSPATGEDVQSPGAVSLELEEDKQIVFLKVAQAGQTVLKIYRQLHRLKLVSYTFLATHHLFMSGISFLYAIWGSTLVRSQLTIDDVDFTVLAATSVLSDLIEKCPPAEACRDAFVRMSKATITMVMSTTGFGNASTLGKQPLSEPENYLDNQPPSNNAVSTPPPVYRRPIPKFDMNLRDLFSEEELASRPPLSRSAPFKSSSNFRLPQHPTLSNDPPASPFSDPGNGLPPPTYPPLLPSVTKPLSPPRAPTMDWTDYANLDLDFLDDFHFPSDVIGGSAGTDPWNPPADGSVAPDSSTSQIAFPAGNHSTFPSAHMTGPGLPGFDSSGAWEANGELFDAFFFGPTSGNGGAYNGF